MTCIVHRKNPRDLSMADVKQTLDDNGKLKYTVTTSKANIDYIVSKTQDGYSSYHVTLTKGDTPKSLQGIFTTPDKALKALLKYIENMKESTTVQRDKKYQENLEWKKKQKNAAAKIQSDDKGKVQQGASN